jgi:hypothetical protein
MVAAILSSADEKIIDDLAAKVAGELRDAKREARMWRSVVGHLLGGESVQIPAVMVLGDDASYELHDGVLTVSPR